MQLKYEHCYYWDLAPSILQNAKQKSDFDSKTEYPDGELENLGSLFKELGFCMIHLGLRLARVCDRAISGHQLESSLLESCAAKGRLIHYHSALDTQLIKRAASKNRSQQGRHSHQPKCKAEPGNLWQQWHYDYGVFTVLTSPMFMCTHYDDDDEMNSCECSLPSAHSCLQIVDPNTNKVCTVKAPPESFIIQVGESADILSKGKLRSTLHSVCRSAEMEKISRETFVVFLQPAWSKVFDLTDYPVERCIRNGYDSAGKSNEGFEDEEQNEGIHCVIPQLRSRLKSGMTFAEFSLETTKQYYGDGGLQANR